MWIQAVQNLQPEMNYYPYQEAQHRQIADWLIGMNEALYIPWIYKQSKKYNIFIRRVIKHRLYIHYQRQKQ